MIYGVGRKKYFPSHLPTSWEENVEILFLSLNGKFSVPFLKNLISVESFKPELSAWSACGGSSVWCAVDQCEAMLIFRAFYNRIIGYPANPINLSHIVGLVSFYSLL